MAPPRHPLRDIIDDVARRLTGGADALGFPGLRVIRDDILTDTRFTLAVETRRPVGDLDRARAQIAARLGLPVGMLRQAVEVPANAGQALLHFQVGRPHDGKPVLWSSDLLPASILDPVPIGVGEDGTPRGMVLASAEGGVRHGAVSGKTGFGKTVHQIVVGSGVAGAGITSGNAVLLVADLKGTLDFAPLAPVCAAYTTNAADTTAMLVALAGLCTEPGSRGALQRRGDRVLVAREGSPALILLIDELRMAFSPHLNPHWQAAASAAHTLGMLGRAFGVAMHLAGQDMSAQAMPQTQTDSATALRRQLHHARVFHEDSKASGEFLLDDYATLDVSSLQAPGRFFHRDGQASSIPVHGFDAEPLTVHEWALRNHDRLCLPDGYTARLLGEWWPTRWKGIPPRLAEWLPTGAAEPVGPQPQPVTMGAIENQRSAHPLTAELAALEGQLSDLFGHDFTAPSAQPVTPLDDPALESLAAALETARTGRSRAELIEATGRGRTWLGERLSLAETLRALRREGRSRATRWLVRQAVDATRLRDTLAEADRMARDIHDDEPEEGDNRADAA
ncbi:hypothetical protein C1I98_33495 [Spongiactinospora gelatinilytica]|uniref:FtsK domain-containing protein n=1 Tax=Spongiactinospora gelatinilytica TaxID=2666298 RepID=A0A2W2EX77_9ACTN|nr:hypothetical protein C1I98_33495 [Spongiactinospora gelatinilytica]